MADGALVLEAASNQSPDVIVLDVMSPTSTLTAAAPASPRRSHARSSC